MGAPSPITSEDRELPFAPVTGHLPLYCTPAVQSVEGNLTNEEHLGSRYRTRVHHDPRHRPRHQGTRRDRVVDRRPLGHWPDHRPASQAAVEKRPGRSNPRSLPRLDSRRTAEPAADPRDPAGIRRSDDLVRRLARRPRSRYRHCVGRLACPLRGGHLHAGAAAVQGGRFRYGGRRHRHGLGTWAVRHDHRDARQCDDDHRQQQDLFGHHLELQRIAGAARRTDREDRERRRSYGCDEPAQGGRYTNSERGRKSCSGYRSIELHA